MIRFTVHETKARVIRHHRFRPSQILPRRMRWLIFDRTEARGVALSYRQSDAEVVADALNRYHDPAHF